MTCGGTPGMPGGRRRKGGKKTRKMRGGLMYGFTGAEGTNGAGWGPVDASRAMLPNGGVDTKTNSDFTAGRPENSAIVGGKRRTRKAGKSKKGGKKSKKSMRRSRGRKMRGGAGVEGVNGGIVNAGAVGYGYTGPQGGVTGGIAPAAGYSAKTGGYGPTAGADGVFRA